MNRTIKIIGILEPIKQRLFLLAATILLTSCTAKKEDPEPKRPNVLFIAVDDLRPMLGSYGDANIKTPNMDRLAGTSTLFERSYCNVPVCGASRASILTGLRPTRNRFLDYDTWTEKDAPEVTTLPEHFKKNGYYTASLGKIFHFMDDTAERSWSEVPWRAFSLNAEGKKVLSRNYLLPSNLELQARPGKRGYSYEMAEVPDSAYFDGQMTNKAIERLKGLSQKDTSFFLAIGFLKPHLPFNAPKKYWDLYPEESIQLANNGYWPKGAPREDWYGTGELRKYHGVPSGGPIPDTLAVKLIRGYRASISYVDALVGKVLHTLKETGLDKNTIVVLWGDHGYLLGEHRLWCKHMTFEKALHVPLLIHSPGQQNGQRARGLTEYVDIYPTLCDMAGLEKPEHLAGASLLPILEDPTAKGKAFVTSRYLDLEAIKTDRYLYTEWIDSLGQVENRMLYDHNTDPDENTNISELLENAELVKELAKKLAERYASETDGI